MKKLLLIFYMSIIYSNFSIYAAFPVEVKIHSEIIESKVINLQDPLVNIGIASFILSIAGFSFLLLQYILQPDSFLPILSIFGLVLLILAFILFIIWMTNKIWSKWFLLSFAVSIILLLSKQYQY